MDDSDKLGLGLDEIIRSDRSSNRRGGRGGRRGFQARGGGRAVGQSNGFRTRGGGGLVTIFIFILLSFISGICLASNIQYTSRPLET